MMLPTIHLNGTHPRDLLADLMDAMAAVRTALHTVTKAGPNGRDYYPQGSGAIHIAMEEHEQRLAHLRTVLTDLEAAAAHVSHHV